MKRSYSFYYVICLSVTAFIIICLLISCNDRDLFITDEEERVQNNDQWHDLKEKVFSLLNHSEENEAFIFFTDPHLLGYNNVFSDSEKSILRSYFITMKEVYDKLLLSFCLCGGDWLNSGDTQEMAKYKLLYSNDQLKRLFKYYKIFGNHDTNYQGVVSSNDYSRGDLSKDFIDNDYFSETGSAFYSFSIKGTTFYILDSDLDWSVNMDDYKWKQIKWLAENLYEKRTQHIVIGIHMFYRRGSIIPMSEELVKLCDAYNNNQSYSVDGIDYNYLQSHGKIHTIISGHSHRDSVSFVGSNLDIPVIQTLNFTQDNRGNFDICVLDYNTGYLEMIRIGKGNDRRVKIRQ